MPIRRLEGLTRNPDEKRKTTIIGKREIGRGHFGVAYAVDVEIQVGERSRTAPFVFKQFFDRFGKPGSGVELAERAAENHARAKEVGLKVFKTYRYVPEHSGVLMTSGHTDETVCIGTNLGSDSVRDYGELRRSYLPDDANIETVANSVFDQAAIATQAHITLDADCMFFLVSRSHPEHIDFVIGDYDMMVENDDSLLEQHNLANMFVAVREFIRQNFRDEVIEPLVAQTHGQFIARGGDDQFLAGLSASTVKKG